MFTIVDRLNHSSHKRRQDVYRSRRRWIRNVLLSLSSSVFKASPSAVFVFALSCFVTTSGGRWTTWGKQKVAWPARLRGFMKRSAVLFAVRRELYSARIVLSGYFDSAFGFFLFFWGNYEVFFKIVKPEQTADQFFVRRSVTAICF